jgi:hypothetical protein
MAGVDVGDCVFYANLEAYSCKSVRSDRKLSHLIERRLAEEENMMRVCSPPSSSLITPLEYIASSFGSSCASSPSADTPTSSSSSSLSKHNSQLHVHTLLVLCLNHTYNNEFDFSSVPREYFQQTESLTVLRNTINTLLARVSTVDETFFEDFWQTVSDVIDLPTCDFYTFNPDEGEDPIEQIEKGTLWSKHFFFYSKKQRRILLFRCWAKSKLRRTQSFENEEDSASDAQECDEDEDNTFNSKNIGVHYHDGSSDDSSADLNLDY